MNSISSAVGSQGPGARHCKSSIAATDIVPAGPRLQSAESRSGYALWVTATRLRNSEMQSCCHRNWMKIQWVDRLSLQELATMFAAISRSSEISPKLGTRLYIATYT